MFVILGTSSVGLVLRFRPQSSETGTHSGVDADTVENKQMISWSKIHQMNYKDTSFLVVRLDKSEMKFTVKSNEECRYLWVRSIGNHQVCQYAAKFSCLIGMAGRQFVRGDILEQDTICIIESIGHAKIPSFNELFL